MVTEESRMKTSFEAKVTFEGPRETKSCNTTPPEGLAMVMAEPKETSPKELSVMLPTKLADNVLAGIVRPLEKYNTQGLSTPVELAR